MELRTMVIDEFKAKGMSLLKKDDKFLLYETTGELLGLFKAIEDYKIFNKDTGVGGVDCIPLDKEIKE